MFFMAAKIQNSYEKVYLPYMSFVVGDTIMSFSTFTSDMYTNHRTIDKKYPPSGIDGG